MVHSNLCSAERLLHLPSARGEDSPSVDTLERKVVSVARSVVLVSIDVGGGATN